MNYELAKKLNDAGFKTKSKNVVSSEDYCEQCIDYHHAYVPSLEELIEACNKLVEDCVYLSGHKHEWTAVDGRDGFGVYGGIGETPSEAVANLWLALNKK